MINAYQGQGLQRETETPPRGRRRAGDAISGGVNVCIMVIKSIIVKQSLTKPRGEL